MLAAVDGLIGWPPPSIMNRSRLVHQAHELRLPRPSLAVDGREPRTAPGLPASPAQGPRQTLRADRRQQKQRRDLRHDREHDRQRVAGLHEAKQPDGFGNEQRRERANGKDYAAQRHGADRGVTSAALDQTFDREQKGYTEEPRSDPVEQEQRPDRGNP